MTITKFTIPNLFTSRSNIAFTSIIFPVAIAETPDRSFSVSDIPVFLSIFSKAISAGFFDGITFCFFYGSSPKAWV